MEGEQCSRSPRRIACLCYPVRSMQNAIKQTRLQLADEKRNGVIEPSTDARMPSYFSAGKILRKIVSLASNSAGAGAGDAAERMALTDEQVLKQLKM